MTTVRRLTTGRAARSTLWGAAAVVLGVVLWELVKAVVPDGGWHVGEASVLPRTDDVAMPQGEDTFHAASYQAAGLLAKAGVMFAFSSGGYDGVRLIPFQAAMSVAWGLDRDEAIKALTINAAKIFGADKMVGSLEAGKLANLIVVGGDPLEIRSQIRHVVIAGHSVPLESKQTELFRRYMGR